MRFQDLALVLSASLGVVACGASEVGGSTSEQAENEILQSENFLSSTSLVAIYRGIAPDTGELLALELRADRTYRGAVEVQCVAAPCYPIVETGSWSASGQLLTLGETTYGYRLLVNTNGEKTLILRTPTSKQRLVSVSAEPCGPVSCPTGTVCCNASCGLCAPIGTQCLQLSCG